MSPGADVDLGEPSTHTGDLWGSERHRLQEELLQELPEDGGKVFAEGSRKEVSYTSFGLMLSSVLIWWNSLIVSTKVCIIWRDGG